MDTMVEQLLHKLKQKYPGEKDNFNYIQSRIAELEHTQRDVTQKTPSVQLEAAQRLPCVTFNQFLSMKVVRHLKDGILSFSFDGTCTYANPRTAYFFGVHHDDLIGTTMERICSHPLLEGKPLMEEFLAVKDQGGHGNSVLTSDVKNRKWYEILPINQESSIVVVIKDITDSKIRENTILSYKSALEDEIERQTLELKAEIVKREEIQQQLMEQSRELKQRVRAFNCLYLISELFSIEDNTLDQRFSEVSSILHSAIDENDQCCVIITHKSREFKEGSRALTSLVYSETLLEDPHENCALFFYSRESLLSRMDYEQIRELLSIVTERLKTLIHHHRYKKKHISTSNMLLAVMEHSPNTIMLLDPSGTIEYANHSFEGYTKSSLKGKDMLSIVPEFYNNKCARTLINTLLNSKTNRIELNHSGLTWYEFIFTPYNYIDDEIYVILIINDITAHKSSEESLQQTVEDLQRFNKLAVNRESRMIELKEEINGLLVSMSRSPKYTIRTAGI